MGLQREKIELINKRMQMAELIRNADREYHISETQGKRYEIMADYLMSKGAAIVVLCKDCEFWGKATVNKMGFLICPVSGMDIMHNDFCSFRQRKRLKR